MNEIIAERYNADEWNIYAAQTSDGDNWADDTPQCGHILRNKLLSAVRYFAYIEVLPAPTKVYGASTKA